MNSLDKMEDYGRLAAENESLRRQLADAQKLLAAYTDACKAMADDGWLYFGVEGMSEAQEKLSALISNPTSAEHLDALIKQATEPLERKIAEQQAQLRRHYPHATSEAILATCQQELTRLLQAAKVQALRDAANWFAGVLSNEPDPIPSAELRRMADELEGRK